MALILDLINQIMEEKTSESIDTFNKLMEEKMLVSIDEKKQEVAGEITEASASDSSKLRRMHDLNQDIKTSNKVVSKSIPVGSSVRFRDFDGMHRVEKTTSKLTKDVNGKSGYYINAEKTHFIYANKLKHIKEEVELDEGTHYHSVWVKPKGDDTWSHHFDADNKEDAADEARSCRNNGEKVKVLRVHKDEADWRKPEHRAKAVAKLNEEVEELSESSISQLKKYSENPYSIGANRVVHDTESGMTTFKFDNTRDRDKTKEKLKDAGFKSKQMSQSTSDKAFAYRHELHVHHNGLNEETQLDEISKETLKSYVGKATKSKADLVKTHNEKFPSSEYESHYNPPKTKSADKIKNRSNSIYKAEKQVSAKNYAEANKKVHPVETQWHHEVMSKHGYESKTPSGTGFVRSYEYEHPKTGHKMRLTTGASSDYWTDNKSGEIGYHGSLEKHLKKNEE